MEETFWSLGASGDSGISFAFEVRNEALFVSVGYRSGFLGHWAHEELAKEDSRSRITRDFDPVAFVYLVQKTMSWIEFAGF